MSPMKVRVLIVGKHPWADHTGELRGEQMTSAGRAWIVALDSGQEVFVFPGQFRRLRTEEAQ